MVKATIRPAFIEDFDNIFLLLEQLWPTRVLNKTTPSSLFIHGIGSGQDEYFCAEINDRVIGFCSLTIRNIFQIESLIGKINELVVDKSFRGQGIGTDLINMAIDTLRERDCTRVEVTSVSYRKDVYKFYKKLGFIEMGYEKRGSFKFIIFGKELKTRV